MTTGYQFKEKNNGQEFAVELDALTVYAPEEFKEMVQDTVSGFYDQDVYNWEVDKRSTKKFKKEIRQQVKTKVQEFLDSFDPKDVGSEE